MSRSRYRMEDDRETSGSRKVSAGGMSGRGGSVFKPDNHVSELAAIIDEVAAERPTAPEFVERLAARGVTAIPSIQSSGRLNGFSFRWSGQLIRGSSIGRAYTGQKLQKRGVNYDAQRDAAVLIAAAERAGLVYSRFEQKELHTASDSNRECRAERLRDPRTGLNEDQKRNSR